jgi:hypothetical protein
MNKGRLGPNAVCLLAQTTQGSLAAAPALNDKDLLLVRSILIKQLVK